MDKLLALEYMVPDKLKKELFHDLGNSAVHFGLRIQRLEERFGGKNRQLQYLVDVIKGALENTGGKRMPYTELLELVRHVDSNLVSDAALPGAADTVMVLLKELVPHHLKTGYLMEMERLEQEEAGDTFLRYLLKAINVEIKAQESNPNRREKGDKVTAKDSKEKADKPRLLGKLYKTRGKARRGSSSSAGSGSTSVKRCSSGSEEDGKVHTAARQVRKLETPKCPCCKKGEHYLHSCY